MAERGLPTRQVRCQKDPALHVQRSHRSPTGRPRKGRPRSTSRTKRFTRSLVCMWRISCLEILMGDATGKTSALACGVVAACCPNPRPPESCAESRRADGVINGTLGGTWPCLMEGTRRVSYRGLPGRRPLKVRRAIRRAVIISRVGERFRRAMPRRSEAA